MTDSGPEFFDAASFFDRCVAAPVYGDIEAAPIEWDAFFIKFIKGNLSGNTLLPHKKRQVVGDAALLSQNT